MRRRFLMAGVLMLGPVLLGYSEHYTDTWKMVVSLSASALALASLYLGALRSPSAIARAFFIYCMAATVANSLGLVYMRFWSPISDIGGAGFSLLALYWATAACGGLLAASVVLRRPAPGAA